MNKDATRLIIGFILLLAIYAILAVYTVHLQHKWCWFNFIPLFFLQISFGYLWFWYPIIRNSRNISELKDGVFYAVIGVNEWSKLVQLRLVTDDLGRLDPQSVKSEVINYKYNKAVVKGEFVINGLVIKRSIGDKIYLSPTSFPDTNIGGVLQVWHN